MTPRELLTAVAARCGRVWADGSRLRVRAPAPLPPELIERLREAKPALVAHLADACAHCREPEGVRGPLLPIGTADDGHSWVHDGCYRAWLAARRVGKRTP